MTEENVDGELVERIVVSSLDETQRQVLSDRGEIDFCFDLPGVGLVVNYDVPKDALSYVHRL